MVICDYSGCISFIFLFSAGYAQKADSLKNLLDTASDSVKAAIYQQLDRIYIKDHLDSSIYFLDQAIALAQQPQEHGLLLDLMLKKANRLVNNNQINLAELEYVNAMKIAESSTDSLSLAKVYYEIGYFYINRTRFDKGP